WGGLRQFLVIVLSRIGYAPSAIMIDEGFNYDTNQFSSFDSFISELNTAFSQYKNEIQVKEKSFLLTDFQKDIWDKCKNSDFVGISAPTSAGKSFIIVLKAIENILESGGNIVYVVPTLSLISQVTRDFLQNLRKFQIGNYEVLTSYNRNNAINKIYVLTPERAISAYNENDKPFGNVNTFIVDEIQNIERIENKKDERAKILFDSLVELSFSYNPNLIIFSGPRVTGLKEMGFDIFEEEETVEIQTNSSPVASFTYSIFKNDKKYFFKQYSQLNNQAKSFEIKNNDFIKVGGKQYNEAYFNYLSTVIHSLGENTKNVIFAPSSGSARKIAINLARMIQHQSLEDEKMYSLKSYISSTVHPKYDLINTLSKKIAYHHGKVPLHIRNILEYAINHKMIDNIVCTTTLMQGVNLPAQNVIMRNGYLSTKKIKGEMPELTNYEISNLRGRAGRLLKDIIGRTFVLDENAFIKKKKEEEQKSLFQDENKPLK
ncbi:MAG: DEAD/DEAH box helicase, partial [Psychroflexus halocasei]